jgi:uncharacterized protein involved in exopolysaccharide biosynthesis
MIDLLDLVRMVWRQRLVSLATVIVVVGATGAYVATQKPMYQSTETLQLSSADPAFLADVNSLTPLYSELLIAKQTLATAQDHLGSAQLATVAVRIFTDSPVLKLDATASSADIAQQSAAAVVSAVSQRLASKAKVGAPGVTLAVIDGPSQADIVWPRPALSLGVAVLVGVLLAVGVSWLADTRRRPALAVSPAPQDPTFGRAVPARKDVARRTGTKR